MRRRPLAHRSGHGVAAWMRCCDGGLRSSRKAGRIGRGHKLPPQLGHTPIKWPSTQRRQKVHSYVQIIASVDAGGRSTSQHSQLGRSSSTPQVYLMMTAGTPSRRVIIRRFRAGHTVGRCRQVPLTYASRCEDCICCCGARRDASPRSRTALTLVEVPHPAMIGKP